VLSEKNKVTDKLKRFAVTFAIVVFAQLLLGGPDATAAWWQASADLAGNSMSRLASVVDSVSNTADGINVDAATP